MRTALIALMAIWAGTAHAGTELSAAIENVRVTCGGIGAELTDMKKLAGITTAVTGVGTVAGGVALGAGLAKADVDERFARLVKDGQLTVIDWAEVSVNLDGDTTTKAKEALAAKSKQLGNIRTGTLAVATATNIAGAIMAGTNKVKGDLKSQIDECLVAVKTLSNVRMQARMDESISDAEFARAEEIIRACDEWSMVDIEPINNRSTGATVSSGIGAATGLAGTLVSASANSENVRSGDAEKGKNLNTTANVLAGTTTVASAAATVFNATQINAIKRAAAVADECEGALK